MTSSTAQSPALSPFATRVAAYRTAGWRGAIPIGRGPAQKSPPPTGFTGWSGAYPSGADVAAWLDGAEAGYNIGLHLHPGVYVLDVDDHHDKPASVSLGELEAVAGQLPRTWSSTSRGASAQSRHYFFRYSPEMLDGRVWKDHPGAGLDSLHTGHRYAVVWPSVHPSGATYEWYDPEGELYEGVPAPEELAQLPAAWVEILSKTGTPIDGSSASDEATQAALFRFRSGPACRKVAAYTRKELERISACTEGGTLREPGKIHTLVLYGLEGHAGVLEALGQHEEAYVSARMSLRGESRSSASADWWRQVCGSVGKAPTFRNTCECDGPLPEGGKPLLTVVPDLPGGEPEAEVVDPKAERLARLRSALVDTDGLDHIVEPDPLVGDKLYLDSLAWLYGAPGCGKSFVAIDMSGSVGTGIPWQGDAVTRGEVLYLVAEGVGGIKKRVRAWEIARERKMTGVRFLPVAVQATNAAEWAAFVELVAEIRPALIVVDTQARVTVGMEENSAKEMGEFVRRVDELRLASQACVLVVHHTGRAGEHMRGSIAMDGAATTTIKVTKTAELVELECTKQKDTAEFENVRLRMVPTPLLSGSLDSSSDLPQSHRGVSVSLSADSASNSDPLTDSGMAHKLKTWADSVGNEPISRPQLVNRDQLNIFDKNHFRANMDALITRGLVEEVAGTYSKYRLTPLYFQLIGQSTVRGQSVDSPRTAGPREQHLSACPPPFKGGTGRTVLGRLEGVLDAMPNEDPFAKG
jgi:hypothetical protein